MRAIWTGELSFGLVNVPVKVYSAIESHDAKSHQVDAKDGTRIRYKRVREGTDDEVEFAQIANAYESESGEQVVLTKEDLKSMPVERHREIAVTEFVPSEDIDPIQFDRPYYLEPSSKSPKAYMLLRQALQETDRLAICTFTLRNRTRLCALRVVGNVMVLQTLLWPDEIRVPDFPSLTEDVKIRPQELSMAASLIESMSTDFDPDAYEDDYQIQLKQLVEAKSDGRSAFEDTEEDSGDGDDEVADLLAALRASVKNRKAAGNGASKSSAPSKRATASKGRTVSKSGTASKSRSASKSTDKESGEKGTAAKDSGQRKTG
ncbi:Ku protein [Tsukamurella sp. 8F]|uniref:non-homologous end joining protein Ku n=1 Tax=unclassified Tsukamurella TaxID=2633480 RepID=UPI0023B9BD90|nr:MULTISPECIES: Ku protein [unclassified Tsukamurella]MDF0531500.1 Ku protein [Tsukamurella sp. 8J]MDF0588744.1 Ku protein [Tsukamurella sp. 8F]